MYEKETDERPQQYEPVAKPPVRGFGWRPDSFGKISSRKTVAAKNVQPETHKHHEGENAASKAPVPSHTHKGASLPTPSEPVAVPSRSSSNRPSHPIARSEGSAAGKKNLNKPTQNLSPATRSLLAETTIPRRTRFPRGRPRSSSSRNISIDELVQEWKEDGGEESPSLGTSPTMELLLSPSRNEGSQLTVEEEDSSQPARSVSDESMPPLDIDSQSTASSDTMSTPPASIRGSTPQKGRPSLRSSPKSVDALSGHPLENPTSPIREEQNNSTPFKSSAVPSSDVGGLKISQASRRSAKPLSTAPSSSLKSNLTASLDRLRDFSQTFSNFVAPSLPPEDHLSRSLLDNSPPYRPEMRPRPLSNPPTPELRRYLNPHAFQPYDFHLHTTHFENIDLEAAAAHAADDPRVPFAPSDITVIPLEQVRSPKTPSKTTGTARESRLDTEARRQRQRREVRENPEFLRICVLELQMKRAGKTEGPVGVGAVGRRAWWLPPRQPDGREDQTSHSATKDCGLENSESLVPVRWVGANVET